MTRNSTTAEDRRADLGMEGGLTMIQRVAICFAAGVLGALAVVLFSYVLFALGLSAKLGVKAPISFKSPDIYRPLFWCRTPSKSTATVAAGRQERWAGSQNQG